MALMVRSTAEGTCAGTPLRREKDLPILSPPFILGNTPVPTQLKLVNDFAGLHM